MRRRWILVGGVLLASGCLGGTSVDWENYEPGTKDRIDILGNLGNCDGLRQELIKYSQDADQRERTGDGNGDIRIYINNKLDSADCPKD
jgi:hypothetical protein